MRDGPLSWVVRWLTAYQDKHSRDMIDVELVDESWCGRLPSELAGRLK